MNTPFVNVTIPVYNEERTLEANVGKVVEFLKANCSYRHEVVIANNGSTDRTQALAEELSRQHSVVRVMTLPQPGRGRALIMAWCESRADILSYMDCDLSSDLAAFPKLIEPMIAGESDLSIGSRYLDPSMTTRGLKRELLSRGYNLLVKAVFRTKFSDAQCGFKAITRNAADKLLPRVEDKAWFADTELLVVAERLNYRIHELPVRWMENSDSSVRIFGSILRTLRAMIRLKARLGNDTQL